MQNEIKEGSRDYTSLINVYSVQRIKSS